MKIKSSRLTGESSSPDSILEGRISFTITPSLQRNQRSRVGPQVKGSALRLGGLARGHFSVADVGCPTSPRSASGGNEHFEASSGRTLHSVSNRRLELVCDRPEGRVAPFGIKE